MDGVQVLPRLISSKTSEENCCFGRLWCHRVLKAEEKNFSMNSFSLETVKKKIFVKKKY